MLRPKIIAHCLVKNEERFVWYTLNSVLPFVDKIMVWDTGSTDDTVKIIKTIKSKKISLKQTGSVSALGHSQLRQQMLGQTDKKKFAWLLILDGDEIWPKKSIQKAIKAAKNPLINTIVVRTKNLVGDIYHYLPESAGKYQIAGHQGHLGLRLIKLNLPKLTVHNPHGRQTYAINKVPLQNQPRDKIKILTAYYFHATHLPRSSHDHSTLKRTIKRKYELGVKLTKKELPSIFFAPKPSLVPDVTTPMNSQTYLKCLFLTLPHRLKRKIINSPSGY